ncbi:endonuclease/exonuclease/phosphatase family protein [Streptomyces sp. NPDC002057]|uniref:endonuclease/exonuclease/phosphatase family protein n=1 Tax=Streptomyces sp. NPDC002057 TaxID=3154664 RepID=UPI00331A25D2
MTTARTPGTARTASGAGTERGEETAGTAGAMSGAGADGAAGAAGADGAARSPAGEGEPGRGRRIARAVRLWYGRTVLGLAALWLLFAAVRWLVSGRWHWSLILDVVPPLFLTGIPLVLLVAGAAACGRRRPLAAGVSGLALVLALTTGSGFNWPALWRDPGPVPPEALRVVSLNTQYWAMATSTDRLFALLHARDADVYLLQEHVGWTPGLGEDGYWRLDDDAELRRQFPGYHIARRSELLTISRFPILSQTTVGPRPRSTDGGKPAFGQEFAREKVLRTDLDVRGRVLSTYNVHITVPLALDNLNLFSDFEHDPYLRRKHAWRQEEFRGLERDVAANRNPVLIAGDFNATDSMRSLDGVREVAEDATPANPDFLPLSWKFAALGEFGDNVFNQNLPFFRMDWAFTKNLSRVHRYRFLPTDGVSEHRLQELRITV